MSFPIAYSWVIYCIPIILILNPGKSEYICKPPREKVSSDGNHIFWIRHGLEIRVPPGVKPAGHEVEIGIKVYNESNPSFILPQGFSVCSNVYEVSISKSSACELSPSEIQLSLTNFDQPLDGASCCVLRASCDADKWTSDRQRPEHIFVEVQGANNDCEGVSLNLCELSCFLAVAGELYYH